MKTKINVRDQRGAAFIEFALVAPILLLLLFGIIEFSLLLYNKAMITNASREGARLGIVWRMSSLDHPPCGEIQPRVEQYAKDKLVTFAFDEPNPDPTITSCVYADDQNPNLPCPSNCSGFVSGEIQAGDFLRVEVRYPYDFLIFDALVKWTLGDVINLEAVTIMRYE